MEGLYKAPKNSHKGQNGRLLIIGGSKKYHGAPMLSIFGARRFVDLIYFFPGEKDQKLINSIGTIPEVIVLEKIEEKEHYDCVLIGVGLGENNVDIEKIAKKSTKIIVDGDGLKLLVKFLPKSSLANEIEGSINALSYISVYSFKY
jgi:NAD(P)H-hydrate epimerase